MKKVITFAVLASLVLSGCEHKVPEASDISKSLSQEIAQYPVLSVSKVTYLNGIAQPDGSHEVSASVTLEMNQPDDAVEYYRKIGKLVKAISKVDSENRESNAAVMKKYEALIEPLQNQADNLSMQGDDDTIRRNQPMYFAVTSKIAALKQQQSQEMDSAREEILKQNGFATEDAYQQGAREARSVFGVYTAPVYEKYISLLLPSKTMGGQLAYKVLTSCTSDRLDTCAQKSFDNSFEIKVNMIKTDNGWMINEEQ